MTLETWILILWIYSNNTLNSTIINVPHNETTCRNMLIERKKDKYVLLGECLKINLNMKISVQYPMRACDNPNYPFDCDGKQRR